MACSYLHRGQRYRPMSVSTGSRLEWLLSPAFSSLSTSSVRGERLQLLLSDSKCYQIFFSRTFLEGFK